MNQPGERPAGSNLIRYNADAHPKNKEATEQFNGKERMTLPVRRAR